jgi:hypothetical protein
VRIWLLEKNLVDRNFCMSPQKPLFPYASSVETVCNECSGRGNPMMRISIATKMTNNERQRRGFGGAEISAFCGPATGPRV